MGLWRLPFHSSELVALYPLLHYDIRSEQKTLCCWNESSPGRLMHIQQEGVPSFIGVEVTPFHE